MSATDLEILQQYTRQKSEDAFAELVRRHLDLVYSAALRQVRSPQLAEEVAQSVFSDLARSGANLKPDTVLTAWLYQVTRRTAVDVVRRETRRQLREQIATEINAMNATATDWTHIEPLLDEAMSALDDPDRAAVLLRYFENKSLREVGQQLGVSDDAAQKRVSRAVEQLREFFTKRGVTIGASGLVIVMSANAVQAAPVGLAVTIAGAAATLTGTTLATTTTATVPTHTLMTSKTMTAIIPLFQKALITATLASATGWGIYEGRRASLLADQTRSVQQQESHRTDHVALLHRERADATNKFAALQEQNEQLRRDKAEIPRLRDEIGRLRSDAQELAKRRAASTPAGTGESSAPVQTPGMPVAASSDASEAPLFSVPTRQQIAAANRLKQLVKQMPDKDIPEIKYLADRYWLLAAWQADLATEAGINHALAEVRRMAKGEFGARMTRALRRFIVEHDGALPASVLELQSYINPPPDENLLGRYEVVHSGKFADVPKREWVRMAVEKAPPVEGDEPMRLAIGLFSTGWEARP